MFSIFVKGLKGYKLTCLTLMNTVLSYGLTKED